MGNQNQDGQQNQEQQDEELIVVETKPGKQPINGSDQDEHDDDDHDDNDQEARGDDRRAKREDGDHGDEDVETIRQRRRQEKLERKQRKNEAIRRNNIELNFLRKRNDDLERRLSGIEQNVTVQREQSIETAYAKHKRDYDLAEQVIAKATAAGNGDDVIKGMRYRDDAKAKMAELEIQFQQHRQQQTRQSQQGQQQPDPLVLRHAHKFISENDWYDPSGQDEDSAIVMAIDAGLVREGYNPQTNEYWEELRDRAKRRLPERFKTMTSRKDHDEDGEDDDGTGSDDGQQRRQQTQTRREARGGPALGSGRSQGAGGGQRQIYISPERKQALIDAGVWDDPQLRAKYVKRYAEYDREQRRSSR